MYQVCHRQTSVIFSSENKVHHSGKVQCSQAHGATITFHQCMILLMGMVRENSREAVSSSLL